MRSAYAQCAHFILKIHYAHICVYMRTDYAHTSNLYSFLVFFIIYLLFIIIIIIIYYIIIILKYLYIKIEKYIYIFLQSKIQQEYEFHRCKISENCQKLSWVP